jgi:L-ascorbate metabolism protein UlaG (beta-lactamase superfamily)
MKIQLIRHATLLVNYGGKKILVDPMFSPAGAMDPVANAASDARNPTVELKVSLDDCLAADAVLLTHRHRDHFDEAAAELLPKHILFLCQPADLEYIAGKGFTNTVPIENFYDWDGVQIFRTGGHHGSGEMAVKMGPVSGFVLCSVGEKTLYIVGDTLWCDEVRQALERHQPEVAVAFAGAAEFLQGGPITMNERDLHSLHEASPHTSLIVAHMEAWGHCALTRDALRQYAATNHVPMIIPDDGEIGSW